MNFLQLTQSLQTECGVSGTLTTTAGQIGSLGRLVTWVNQAWNEIQTVHDDWYFMRSSALLGKGCSFATTPGGFNYPLGTGAGTCGVLVANFGKWAPKTFRNYTTSVGFTNEIYMDDINFDVWRDSYMYGAMRDVETRPVAIAFGPDESICVGPPSDGDYTVYGDYFTAPTQMVNDTDTPTNLPAAYHMIIVYRAMQKYAYYESAPEVKARADMEYTRTLSELEAFKLPEMALAGSIE